MATHGVTSEFNEISLESEGAIAVVRFRAVTLARPLIAELYKVLGYLESDSRIRSIIFTGQRSVFMTGAERAELSALRSREDIDDFLQVPHELVHRFLESEKLLVAAINGYCLGGGLEFALACDFRTCASDLKGARGADLEFVGLPEASLGVVPAVGGAYLSQHTVGILNARRLLLMAKRYGADEAHAMGLVDILFPRARLLEETEHWVLEILSRSPRLALAQTKKLLNAPLLDNLEQNLRLAARCLTVCCESDAKDETIGRNHQAMCLQFRQTNDGVSRKGALLDLSGPDDLLRK